MPLNKTETLSSDVTGDDPQSTTPADLAPVVDCLPQELDIKVAVIGNVDSGKSTLVGVMTKNILDDGRGAARSLVFNFNHEQANGRTSSIAQEIMGFNTSTGEQINAGGTATSTSQAADMGQLHRAATNRNSVWPSIVKKSNKVVTFIDLCGHEKYLKTTIFGLVGLSPDYAMIVINANAGFQRMTREHLGIALALKVPVFVVVTKIDVAPPNVFEQHMDQLSRLLKSPTVKKMPMIIRGTDEEANVHQAAQALRSNRVCPIFCVSNVTGEGLSQLRIFMSSLVSRFAISGVFKSIEDPAEYNIDGVFTVTGVGCVTSGTVQAGTIKMNQQLLLGPDKVGNFKPVLIRSIHVKRVQVEEAHSGQSACFALRSLVKKDHIKRAHFRKGMVLVDPALNPKSIREFDAEVVILHHATTIKERYQAVIHVGVIRQAAQVLSMSRDLLRTGDKAIVRFRFMYHGEYLQPGQTILFREGRTKGLGKVSEVFPEESRIQQ